MNIILQGLTISVLGLVVTFTALIILILIINLLERFFPVRVAEAEVESVESVTVAAMAEEDDREVIAAIAAAVSQLHLLHGSQLGRALDRGRGRWWELNRFNLQHSIHLKRK